MGECDERISNHTMKISTTEPIERVPVTALTGIGMMRNLLHRSIWTTHLWLGLALTIYVSLVGVSGAVLVWGEAIDRWQNPALLRVVPQEKRASLTQIVGVWKARYPSEPLRNLRLSDPHDPTAVWTAFAGRGASSRTVYLDPYRATILGERGENGGFIKWLSDLHFRLLLGDFGWKANGWGAIGTLLVLASGVWMWWPRTMRQLRVRVAVKRGNGARRLWRDLHLASGFWSVAILTLVTATGAVFIWWQPVQDAVYKLTGTPQDATPKATATGKARTPDELLSIAQKRFPEAQFSGVGLPTKAGEVFTLYVTFGGPGQWGPFGQVSLDPKSGQVLGVQDGRVYPLGKRIMAAIFPLHAGLWGGVLVKLLYTLAGVLPLVLSVSGALVWWNKRRAQRRRTLEPPSIPETVALSG